MIQIQNMSTAVEYPHLTIDTDGNLRLGKSRYKVTHLAAEHFQHGWSGEELLRQHPDLAPGEVYSALAYFYDPFLYGRSRSYGSNRWSSQTRNRRLDLPRRWFNGARRSPSTQKSKSPSKGVVYPRQRFYRNRIRLDGIKRTIRRFS